MTQNRAVWKFPLNETPQDIEAPIVDFLTVQYQGDTICVWAIVNQDTPPSKYRLYVEGTGWESSKISHDTYIGTVQGDGCVWHIFYEKITKPLKQAQPDKTFAMFTNPRNNERMTQI